MDRRKMLNMVGLGGLTTWTGTRLSAGDLAGQDIVMDYHPTFLELISDKNLRVGQSVTTLGYYQVNDGGGGWYTIEPPPGRSLNPGDGEFELTNGLVARLSGAKSVNYRLFGAKGDGETDDGSAIKAAHGFANQQRLPVHNPEGKFRIEKTRAIPIEANVQWGQSEFYINEKYNTDQPVFHVKSRYEPIEISASDTVGRALVDQLHPGVQVIPELRDFENHLIHLHDDEDRIAFRAGSYNSNGRAREELIYVSLQGRILGDVAWSFRSTVKITAYPTEESYLVVEGGTFYLSGESPVYDRGAYSHNGILVTRSRTRIRRQWVGIAPGREDVSMTPRYGFYYFTTVYDVHLEDIRLNPREKNREGDDRDVPHGTYGIGGNRVLELSMHQVVSEGTGIHWGVMGTNMMKNITVTNCRINRFDVHFHLWNLTLRDCEIGHNGITVTGGGRLLVENTFVSHQRFISFRQDFGAKWDGDIVIDRCGLRPIRNSGTVLLNFGASDFDYGYPIGIARSLIVRDFVVDYSTVPDNDRDCWLMQLSEYAVTATGDRLFFPEYLRFENVRVMARKKGIRITRLVDCKGYLVGKSGEYDGDILTTNAYWHFENVDLQEVLPGQDPPGQFHLGSFSGQQTQSNYESDSPHLHLLVRNCRAFSAILSGIRIRLQIQQSTIHQLILHEQDKMEGELTVQGCHLIPVPLVEYGSPYHLDTSLGTSFLNCVVHLPGVHKPVVKSDLKLISFFRFNKYISYNHLNTRLSNGLIRFLDDHQMQISPEFRSMLLLSSDG